MTCCCAERRTAASTFWKARVLVNQYSTDAKCCGVKVKVDGREHEYRSPCHHRRNGTRTHPHTKAQLPVNDRSKAKLIAFKVHLRNTRVAPNACEIYFYPEGYGGLSTVEGDISNLCFIISAEQVKRHHSNPETVMRETVMKNRRAAYTLEHAQTESEWLSASWERFGRQRPSPAKGLLAIGDSAAFIDPFTGSGMLMAFESGELAADVIIRHRDELNSEALRIRIHRGVRPKVRLASANLWIAATRRFQTSPCRAGHRHLRRQ